jgi:hypothetical protein
MRFQWHPKRPSVVLARLHRSSMEQDVKSQPRPLRSDQSFGARQHAFEQDVRLWPVRPARSVGWPLVASAPMLFEVPPRRCGHAVWNEIENGGRNLCLASDTMAVLAPRAAGFSIGQSDLC